MHRRGPGNQKTAANRPAHGSQAPSSPPPSAPCNHPGDGGEAFRHLMEHSGDGYFEVDLKGSFTFANAATSRFTGWSREEMIGLNYRAIMSPEQAERNFKLYNDVYRTGRPSPLIEYEIIRKDGSSAINETTVALMRDAQGAPVGFCGMVRDLTEKRRVERTLAESEEKHRYILTNMEDGYYETDLAGNFTDFNAATCNGLGRDRQELRAMNFRDCMDAETAQRVFERFSEVFQTGQPAQILECKLIRKDGAVRTHELSASLLRNAAGEPTGFFGISRDRTEQLQMERDLRESEESYRSVLELSPDAIAINDSRTERYVQVNAAFCQHVGYAAEEIIGRTAQELDIYANHEDYARIKTILTKERKLDGLEISYKDRAGHRFEDLVSARMIRFKGRSCVLFMGTVITPLKQAQEALRDSEESYRRIMELAPDIIVITRVADGRIVAVNETFCARTGYSREEALGHTPVELGLYTDPENRRKWIEMLQRDGQVRGIELQFLTREGLLQDDLFSAQYIRFKGEDCVLAVITSITHLKQIQRSLQEREENQRTILDTAPYAITILRQSDLRYLLVNKSFCLNTGYDLDEVIGRTPEDLQLPADPADRERITEVLLHHGRIDGMELRIRKKDGTILETLVSVRPLKFDGKASLLFISADISTLKNTQRELHRYQKKLEQMVTDRTRELVAAQEELVKRERLAVLGQLTATVSHELRNPLGVIRSSNFYLQRKNKDMEEKTLKHFQRIDEQVTLCDTIVADLLEYTRSRRANMVRQALGSWLPQVVEQMQEAWGFAIGLRLSKDLPLWPHDREKMRRVVINVLDNALLAVHAREKALKGDPAYRPSISIEAEAQADSVVLRFIDNGVGMDAETCRRAFEPLFTTRARGTGIGLANVKKIIDEHGGRIDLESRLGQGTRMSIVLPLLPPDRAIPT